MSMDFRNVNPMNDKMNLISGNLLPLATDGRFSTVWRVYQVAVILLEITHVTAMIAGFTLVPLEKTLSDGLLSIIIILEAITMRVSLLTRRKLIMRVICMINDILRTADEVMENEVRSALKMIMAPFAIYGTVSVISVIVWTAQPVTLVFERSSFLYVDYNLPAAFSPEPFSSRVLVSSSILMTFGSVYLFLRKFSVDIYMMHLVLLLTAQYRYTSVKLKMFFRAEPSSDKPGGMHYRAADREQRAETRLRALCRHRNVILHVSFMLRELLSINFSILYINNVFRFCFIGVMMSTIPSLSLLEGMSIFFFACGSVFQFYLLCFAVQTLSDASTQVTDKSFNEGWYQFGSSLKHTFILLIMADNLKCKIAMIGTFDLSLSSFMTIMNRSYSLALLFLRAN